MPTSNIYVWGEVISMVDQGPHESVLDVGPGHGKASILLREYLNEAPRRIDAVEAWTPYVDQFDLDVLYGSVFEMDVCELPDSVLADYDVVLMVDVIEHIPKAKAMALVNRIPGRVVICTPVEFFYNGDGLPPTEDHVSHWDKDDWVDLATDRDLTTCYQSCGGWLVALGKR